MAGIRYLVDNDRHPYIWKTDDYGGTWSTIVSGIPEDDFVRAVREDPTRPGLLYAASETTVYISWTDGASWQPLTLNLPNTQVADLIVVEDDLAIATHGRAFWILYGIGPLREITPDVLESATHLFQPPDVVQGVDATVDVAYYLAEKAQEVKVEFLNESGAVLQAYTSSAEEGVVEEAEQAEEEEAGETRFSAVARRPEPGRQAGINRFRWNMRLDGYTDFEGRIFWAAGNAGPVVVPGPYAVKVTVDGTDLGTRDFQIRLDPRIHGVTQADLQARFDLAVRIRDRVSEANEAVIRIRRIKEQIDQRLSVSEDQSLRADGLALRDALSSVEAEIYQVRNQSNQDPLNFPIKLNNKLAALLGVVEGSENRPTDQSYAVFDYLSGLLQDQLDEMNRLLGGDLDSFNRRLQELGLDAITAGERMQ